MGRTRASRKLTIVRSPSLKTPGIELMFPFRPKNPRGPETRLLLAMALPRLELS
jgi:hypothetical protein